MKNRLILIAVLAIAIVGSSMVGGVFLARSLSASPATSPRLQVAEGRFPLSFQGILMDADGNAVSNGSHKLNFAIYNDATGRGPLWSEEQTVFTSEGLFTVQLGVDEEIAPSIFSENPETFLGINVDRDPELLPRIRLAYSPYAIHALTAESVLSPTINRRRIALGRWYEANMVEGEIKVDDKPGQMAFDGENIWVLTEGEDDVSDDNNATRIGAADLKRKSDTDVGDKPTDIIFDGQHLWVANENDGKLTRFKPDGSNLSILPERTDRSRTCIEDHTLDKPSALGFDGIYIYVSNQGSSNSVARVRASDGIIVDETPGPGCLASDVVEEIAVGDSPGNMAFDGEFMWVLHSGSQNVTKIRSVDGPLDDTDKIALNIDVGKEAIAFDGEHMWIVNKNATVAKVSISDNEVIAEFDVGPSPKDIAFDGDAMWIVNENGNSVTKLRASDGLLVGTYPVGKSPTGIAFDGVNMWVSSSDRNTVEIK